MKECRMKDGRILVFDPLQDRRGKPVPDWAKKRNTAREGKTGENQIVRYLYLDQGFDLADIAELAQTDEKTVHNLFLRWKKYLPDNGMEKLATALGVPFEILLMHAKAFTEQPAYDLPVPVPYLDECGNETGRLGYLGISFLKERVPSLATTFLYRHEDGISLISRAEKDLMFREGALYLVRGMDDSLSLRRGAIIPEGKVYALEGLSHVPADDQDRNLGRAVGMIGKAV